MTPVVDHLGVVPLWGGDKGLPLSVNAWFLYWCRAVQGEEGAPGVEHRRPAKRTRRAVEEGNGRCSRPLTARNQYGTPPNVWCPSTTLEPYPAGASAGKLIQIRTIMRRRKSDAPPSSTRPVVTKFVEITRLEGD